MKKLITAVALTIAATVAHAEPFADAPNQGGGKIVLLTNTCDGKPQMSRAFFYIKDGITEDGCWRFDFETIVVEWEKQGRRRYQISDFRLLNQYSKFKSW